jgi:hypothetical protein
MNKRTKKKMKLKASAKSLEAYFRFQEEIKKYPAWYWKHGLHDAKILSVRESGAYWEPRRGKNFRNYLELRLDGSGALFEQKIEWLRFYNYEIKSMDVPVAQLAGTWWLYDTLQALPNGNYLLNFEVDPENGKHWNFLMEFETGDIQRK